MATWRRSVYVIFPESTPRGYSKCAVPDISMIRGPILCIDFDALLIKTNQIGKTRFSLGIKSLACVVYATLGVLELFFLRGGGDSADKFTLVA